MKSTAKKILPLLMMIPIIFFTYKLSFNANADTPQNENDVWLISSADELKWFSEYINSEHTDASARLTADIDLSSVCSAQSGSWGPIGTADKSYSGTFDGNGYKITGLYIYNNDPSVSYTGFFANNSGTIKNLYLEGTITSEYGTTGGITGLNTGTIENCLFTGIINNSSSLPCGGISGYNDNNAAIKRCCAFLTDNFNNIKPIAGEYSGTIKKCFYNDDIPAESTSKIKSMPKSAFYSGEVCSLLNEKQQNAIWHQNIENSDGCSLPVPSEHYPSVYKTSVCGSDEVYYSNYDMVHHLFDNGSCTSCGIGRISCIGANLVLTESVDTRFHYQINDPELFKCSFKLNYSVGNDTTDLSADCEISDNSKLTALVPGNVTEMGKTIYVQLSAEKDNSFVYTSAPDSFSVIDYADAIVNDTKGTYSENCKKLVLDILRYGYESQIYFNNDDSFKQTVMEKFSDKYTDIPPVQNPDLSEYNSKSDSPQAFIKSSYLTLNSKVSMTIRAASTLSDIYLKAENASANQTQIIPMQNDGEYFSASIADICAENLTDNFKLTIVDKDGNALSDTIGYNIFKYICAVSNSADNRINSAKNICLALAAYAESATEFANNN